MCGPPSRQAVTTSETTASPACHNPTPGSSSTPGQPPTSHRKAIHDGDSDKYKSPHCTPFATSMSTSPQMPGFETRHTSRWLQWRWWCPVSRLVEPSCSTVYSHRRQLSPADWSCPALPHSHEGPSPHLSSLAACSRTSRGTHTHHAHTGTQSRSVHF